MLTPVDDKGYYIERLGLHSYSLDHDKGFSVHERLYVLTCICLEGGHNIMFHFNILCY